MTVIRQTRVQKIERFISHVPEGAEIKIITSLGVTERAVLDRVGFPEKLVSGVTVLPISRGKSSRYNAEGAYNLLKDLPKENRYIRTIYRTWTDWHGGEHGREVDIYKDCYQREFLPPPSLELTYLENGRGSLISSQTFVNDRANHNDIKLAINILLEVTGECEVVLANLDEIPNVEIERVNWTFLPPGENPWDRIERTVMEKTRDCSESMQDIIIRRQENIYRLTPAREFRGEGGFSDYIAYDFPNHGIVVLESLKFGNAIYVFGQNWDIVSRLTKAEVIAGNLQIDRIVHSGGWEGRLARHFNVQDAAE